MKIHPDGGISVECPFCWCREARTGIPERRPRGRGFSLPIQMECGYRGIVHCSFFRKEKWWTGYEDMAVPGCRHRSKIESMKPAVEDGETAH